MKLCINDFEGPLDLLLHLVKTAKMDIYAIDTKYIIDEYLKFINSLDKNDLDNASEYLVMAAELIHLKSRNLLNLESEEDDQTEYSITSEEDLKNKLIEYEKYQRVSDVFKELEEKRSAYFTKSPENIKNFTTDIPLEGNIDVSLLKEALLELEKRLTYQKPLNTKITKKELSVEDRIEYIKKYLDKKNQVLFNDLFEEYTKELIVVTFLSILDMCKNGEIRLTQQDNFGQILIEKVI